MLAPKPQYVLFCGIHNEYMTHDDVVAVRRLAMVCSI